MIHSLRPSSSHGMSPKSRIDKEKNLLLVRLELTTSASLYVYKYSALTDCATGALVLQAQIVALI